MKETRGGALRSCLVISTNAERMHSGEETWAMRRNDNKFRGGQGPSLTVTLYENVKTYYNNTAIMHITIILL